MAETKPKQGTAVATRQTAADAEEALAEITQQAKTPQDRERAYLIADALKQSRMVRSMAAVVAATEWGTAMSPVRQAAYARYCLALGADPLRHVDLLGGNPFINGDYFRDVIAANPSFDHSDDPVWIHDDPRLQLCAVCGKEFGADPAHGHANEEVTEENRRRLRERVLRARLRLENNVAEASPSVCILTLHYKDGRGPFLGIGEVHPGTTAKGSDRDPIGLASPRATAETRAWREAGEKAEATWFRTHARTLNDLQTKLTQAYDAEKAASGRDDDRSVTAIEVDDPKIEVVTQASASGATDTEPMENHNPSGRCGVEGPHPRSSCGYFKKAE